MPPRHPGPRVSNTRKIQNHRTLTKYLSTLSTTQARSKRSTRVSPNKPNSSNRTNNLQPHITTQRRSAIQTLRSSWVSSRLTQWYSSKSRVSCLSAPKGRNSSQLLSSSSRRVEASRVIASRIWYWRSRRTCRAVEIWIVQLKRCLQPRTRTRIALSVHRREGLLVVSGIFQEPRILKGRTPRMPCAIKAELAVLGPEPARHRHGGKERVQVTTLTRAI